MVPQASNGVHISVVQGYMSRFYRLAALLLLLAYIQCMSGSAALPLLIAHTKICSLNHFLCCFQEIWNLGCQKSHSCALFLSGNCSPALFRSISFPGGDPTREGILLSSLLLHSLQKSLSSWLQLPSSKLIPWVYILCVSL